MCFVQVNLGNIYNYKRNYQKKAVKSNNDGSTKQTHLNKTFKYLPFINFCDIGIDSLVNFSVYLDSIYIFF